MKLSEYLKDKIYFIIIRLMVIFILNLLFIAFKSESSLIISVSFIIIIESILVLMIDYFRKKNFYTSLTQKLETLDKKYLVLEMMSRPSFYEGKILYDTIYETDKSMIENVNEYAARILASLAISSSVRTSSWGRCSTPSGGIQYLQRRLHLSVTDMRK